MLPQTQQQMESLTVMMFTSQAYNIAHKSQEYNTVTTVMKNTAENSTHQDCILPT